jgi:hypothetical protein
MRVAWKLRSGLNENFPDIDHCVYNEAFCWACAEGHLQVVQWLKQEFPNIDHRADYNYASRRAYINGHLQVSLWLNKGAKIEKSRIGKNK